MKSVAPKSLNPRRNSCPGESPGHTPHLQTNTFLSETTRPWFVSICLKNNFRELFTLPFLFRLSGQKVLNYVAMPFPLAFSAVNSCFQPNMSSQPKLPLSEYKVVCTLRLNWQPSAGFRGNSISETQINWLKPNILALYSILYDFFSTNSSFRLLIPEIKTYQYTGSLPGKFLVAKLPEILYIGIRQIIPITT